MQKGLESIIPVAAEERELTDALVFAFYIITFAGFLFSLPCLCYAVHKVPQPRLPPEPPLPQPPFQNTLLGEIQFAKDTTVKMHRTFLGFVAITKRRELNMTKVTCD